MPSLPKTVYFYWGSEKMSFLRFMSFKSFRHHHPDWRMVLVRRQEPLPRKSYRWSESQDFMYRRLRDYSGRLATLDIEVEALESEYPEIAARGLSDVHTSDLLSWFILARKGGVVSDTDIIYTATFDYERFMDTEFGMVCFENLPKAGYMPVSFMISQPNEIHERIYQQALESIDDQVYESAGTPAIERAVGSFEEIVRAFPRTKVVRLPSRIVFPFSEAHPFESYRAMAFEQDLTLHPDTIGIHWYAGAPGHQKINRAYRERSYEKFHCTVSRAIQVALS